MKGLTAFAICAVFAACAVPTLADDLNPAPWRTDPAGQDATTLQAWEFDTDNPTPPADVLYNPFGDPSLTVGGGGIWFPNYGGQEGLWRITADDSIIITIPNNPIENEYKHIWLQVTFFEEDGFDPMMLTEPAYDAMETVGSVDLGAGWWHRTYSIMIFPNPQSETLELYAPGCVMSFGEIVIDTICIPEPAGILLLAVAGIFLRRR
jgi:hypothetical protein